MRSKRFLKQLVLSVMSSVILLGVFSFSVRAEVKQKTIKTVHCETKEKKISFQDSLDRKVELPAQIDRIAPSGGLANFILYTLCPEKLVSSGNGFSDKAKAYVPEEYFKLPKTGSLYGRKATILPEEIVKLKPQVIIDIGEIKGSKEEMAVELNRFQKTVKIPTVMVEASVKFTLPQAYRTLGKLLGKEAEAEKLAVFCERVMKRAEKITSSIPYKDRVRVYWAVGKDGLQTEVKGKMNVLPIDKVGGINVVNLPANHGSTKSVSKENILLWQPEVIIAENKDFADKIMKDNAWGIVPAVKNNRVYVIPDVPYSFMSSPPASNQLLGIIWLGQVLYPEKYTYDVKKEIKEFYDLFYHVKLTDKQLKEILNER